MSNRILLPVGSASEGKPVRRSRRCSLALACAAILALAHASAVNGQSPAEAGRGGGIAPESGEQRVQQLDAVVTTASRIRRGGFVAPTPTTQVTAEEIDASGLTNVADVINTIPSVRPSLTQTSSTNNASWMGGNYLDLRGLGASRTLLLVNGKRFVPTQIEGPVDVNVVPQVLVDSIDIVTGGASAAWGSDAVAGVVNLMFDPNFEGFKGKLQYGSSDRGDYRSKHASLGFGQRFADQRGHVVFAAEASDNSGIENLGDRPWGAQGWGQIANPAYTPGNDEPQSLILPDVVYSNASFGGLINDGGPLSGIQFDPGGNPVPFQYGSPVSGVSMVGGDGAYVHRNQTLTAPLERQSVYGRVSFDLTDAVNAYGELSWSKSESGPVRYLARSGDVVIRRDNPFLHESIADAMDLHGIDSFTMNRMREDYAPSLGTKEATTTRGVIGAEGWFDNGWDWDVHYTYGSSEIFMQAHGNRINANFNAAVDAVRDPVTGAIVCRDPDARAAGCVPIDLFGWGASSLEAREYVTGTSWRLWDISQHAAAASVSGEAFQLPAGPVSIAAGLEWRREEATVTADQRSVDGGYAIINTIPWSGSVNVKEAFSEVLVPLARDTAWARALDLSIAGRITDYSTSGTVHTWKIGGSWDIDDMWRIRATRSRDIRAPSLSELFSGASTLSFTVFDPEEGSRYSVRSITSGNADLDPEEADTTTVGVVVNPTPNLMVSLDWYDIEISGAIISLQAAAIVDRCYRNQPQLCGQIVRGGDGLIQHVAASPQNLSSLEVRGADLEFVYRRALGAGELTLRGLAAWTNRIRMDDGETVTEMAGTVEQPTIASIGGTPHWNGNVSAAYRAGPAALGMGVRHVGGGKINHELTSKDRNITEVSGRTYYDLNASYDLTGNLALFGSVRNLFDKYPPIADSGYATIRSLYDVIGRTYTVGLRFDF